jgi:23S rRNA (cytidine1920-2'-O)/16S rRNA (cytidine1409-2'-O)-methyltransferase
LIKPQFEAGRVEVARGKGVVRDPEIHRKVLVDILAFVQEQGFYPQGLIRSPLKGPEGNIEFLAWLNRQKISVDTATLIEKALA